MQQPGHHPAEAKDDPGHVPEGRDDGQVLVPGAHGEGESPREEVEEPARLLRIASTVQALLHEVRTTELDQAARERLTDIHNRMVTDLRGLVSDQLADELRGLALEPEQTTPSGAELRVMQAQLAGWLQGLFHGIQASIATQQMAAQQQLAKMRAQQGGELPGGQPGQYL